MDTLLNFSGGLDSTYCLWKYLKENPSKKLLVHHCHWQTYFNRHDQETTAVKDILGWLKSKGLDNYEYLETTVDIRQFVVKPIDSQVVAFMTGILLLNPKYRSIKFTILPTPKDEFDRLGLNQMKIIWSDSNKIRSLPRLTLAEPRHHELQAIMPVREIYKSQFIKLIPAELKELYFSCRTPKKAGPCGKCHTCRQIESKKH